VVKLWDSQRKGVKNNNGVGGKNAIMKGGRWAPSGMRLGRELGNQEKGGKNNRTMDWGRGGYNEEKKISSKKGVRTGLGTPGKHKREARKGLGLTLGGVRPSKP